MELKVLKGLSGMLCLERHKRNVYETNRAFKAAALFTYLRNLTTSDTIHLGKRYGEDNAAINYAETMGISRASFYNYVSYAEELGLLTKTKDRIRLTSYKIICTKYFLQNEQITIIHEPKTYSLEYTLKALEYGEAREKMEMGLNAKVRNNPTVKAAFSIEATRLGATEEQQFSPVDLWKLQKYVFAAGGSETTYDTLFIPNPDLNRNLYTLARVRKMKSHVSASYERKRLSEIGVLTVTDQGAVNCSYIIATPNNTIKGRITHRNRSYNAHKKQAIWRLPHNILVSSKILKSEACENPPPTRVI